MRGVPRDLAAFFQRLRTRHADILKQMIIQRTQAAALMSGRDDLAKAASVIAESSRSQRDFPTAMGYALGFGAGLLERSPPCLRKVIDMAGDGQNNEGFGPEEAYRAFPFQGVTVNGLVVNAADFEGEVGLIAFYQSQVRFGPGSFVEIAEGFEDYERAMRRKLERELTPPAIGSLMGGERNAG